MYNPETGEGGIFTGYMKEMIRLKEQASGWPRENMTVEEKQAHIDLFLETEGIKLDPSKMIFNSCQRSNSKRFLQLSVGKMWRSC